MRGGGIEWFTVWMEFQEVGFGIMDRIEISQDRDRYRKHVTVIMNFRFPYIARNFLTTENKLISLERLCSME
jgi:translation initiation factor 1 (eIF-1/SUI1)